MSRLYLQFNSDSRQTAITSTGNELIEGVILWGDKNEPKRAVYVGVTWKKGEDKPAVFLRDYTEEI